MKRDSNTSSYRIPELLAPVGGWKQFHAAVNNGADAVYLGGSRFNARGRADNFGREDMKKVCAFARERNVKVYVTFNTLLRDDELPAALEYAGHLYDAGADAVILQDMGLARLLRTTLPGLPLHLSTQATVYGPQAVDLMKSWGFSRIVPARELSLEEIRAFTEACHGAAGSAPCEVEVFVHGALCMCYSGQCQMSRMLGLGAAGQQDGAKAGHRDAQTDAAKAGPAGGGRSANRGFCAQPCRLAYTDDRGRSSYLLSPKDLCLLEELPALCAAGVDSLKIEGRLKSPEYVAVTTSIYRKYLDEYARSGRIEVAREDMDALRQVYSRGAFTTGYLYEDPGDALLSGTLPKHAGLRIGTVRAVPGENALKKKDREAAAAARGAARKGACLLEADLTGSLQEGDGIEVRRAPARKSAEQCADTSGSAVVTYMKREKGGAVLIGDVKGRPHAGDGIYRITDRALMEAARQTFDAEDVQELDRRMQRKVPVDMFFEAAAGRAARLRMSEGDLSVEVCSEAAAETAVNRPSTPERIEQQLRKLGNTPFCAGRVEISVDGACVIPASELNRMRREAVRLLLEAKRETGRQPAGPALAEECRRLAEAAGRDASGSGCPAEIPSLSDQAGSCGVPSPGGPAGSLECAGTPSPDSADAPTGPAAALSPDAVWAQAVPLERWLQGEPGIPHVFPITKGRLDALLESAFDEIVRNAKNTGIILENPGWIQRFLSAGLKVYGGRGLNVFNREAEQAYRDLGVEIIAWSWEAAAPGDDREKDLFRGVPLMITEHPIRSETLTDRKGVVHRVELSPSGDKTIIY